MCSQLAKPKIKVHADATTFKLDVTKQEAYAQVLEQAAALFSDERNWVVAMSCETAHDYHTC